MVSCNHEMELASTCPSPLLGTFRGLLARWLGGRSAAELLQKRSGNFCHSNVQVDASGVKWVGGDENKMKRVSQQPRRKNRRFRERRSGDGESHACSGPGRLERFVLVAKNNVLAQFFLSPYRRRRRQRDFAHRRHEVDA